MKIKEIYEKKQVLSFEIFPPKRDNALKNIDETLEVLCSLNPDFISVTFGAGGSSNNNQTIELAKKIKNDYHIEPLVHLTCLTYDKDEIDNFIYELKESGIENVLALRGDRNPDIKEKKEFLYASDLTSYLKSKSELCVAGACYPECHPESTDRIGELKNLKKKVESGSDFLITQLFLENNLFYSFYEDTRIAGINPPISAGIMPVINKSQIERMISLCGASLPEKFRKIINKYEHNKEALFDAGMSYAIGQVIDLLANEVDGIHLYTMNNPKVAKKLCDGIKSLI
ncbi:methylenetetrahydrofolate reductase [NAD(P)H] [Aminipila sp.]|uniref:methylenetetrahydrofolate reductase [NAD(P)H] n=1 Tax=Aminipila sp. TaxID=2060095 RepID=UPI001D83BBB6|nr:methylenetetrahydrofolate reductase [NAD(P)H] [Aminipila sp.]MBE6035194.1 methylenetetrahydrofolate reductase [NAD(P)H] [Clostridiales bacterium]